MASKEFSNVLLTLYSPHCVPENPIKHSAFCPVTQTYTLQAQLKGFKKTVMHGVQTYTLKAELPPLDAI